MSNEGVLRLNEAIAKQAAKDYIAEYNRFGKFSKSIEHYFRTHALLSTSANYIIENLRAAAISKRRIKRKTNRARVTHRRKGE